MSPKQQVAILVAIFSALGVGVSVAIIASGGGFSGSAGSIFNPPSEADIYRVGSQVTDGMTMEYYSAMAQGPETLIANADVSISFKKSGDSWLTAFNIVNGTGTQPHTVEMLLSRQLTKEGPIDESARPFLEPVEASILAIRDMDYGGRDKYLVVGAPWNTIFYGSTSTIVRVTEKEAVQTPAGTFDAFVLTYKLKDNTSKIWVVKDLPLPVKAETYDQDDRPFYSYELLKLTR
ncbi:MAG: hypothetical protein ABI347_05155 [Nitrososphaera sp.]